jgi:DNA adenine methylase
MGSKNRISKEILPIILNNRKPNQWFVEPFCGGCNITDKVTGNRIANDSNFYLIEMWKALIDGWKPFEIDKEEYEKVKNNKKGYKPYYVGWIGFNCSYSGKWFGGFAGKTKTKINTIRNYQKEAMKNILNQSPKLKEVTFSNLDYTELEIPPNSIIYCDPPYKDTTKYNSHFDHDHFWDWCRDKVMEKHTVFISEYIAPSDFDCIWQKEVKSSLSANGVIGGNKNSVEKLFIW